MRFLPELEYMAMQNMVVNMRHDKQSSDYIRAEGIMFVLEELKSMPNEVVDYKDHDLDIEDLPPNVN